MGVVWVLWGPCWPGSLPKVLAPLQADRRASPALSVCQGYVWHPVPPSTLLSPLPLLACCPQLAWQGWDLTAVCLAVLAAHTTLSILLGEQVCMPSPTPPGVQDWGTRASLPCCPSSGMSQR